MAAPCWSNDRTTNSNSSPYSIGCRWRAGSCTRIMRASWLTFGSKRRRIEPAESDEVEIVEIQLSRSPRPCGAPTIGVGDLAHRLTRQRTEFSLRPANRHQRVGPNVRRQAEHGLHLVFAADVVRRDDGPEPERAARKDDVLHRRINAGAAD